MGQVFKGGESYPPFGGEEYPIGTEEQWTVGGGIGENLVQLMKGAQKRGCS